MQSQTRSDQNEYFVALFDLTHFSTYYKNNSPNQILHVLNEFSALAIEIIENHGGQIIKFSNDSGLAAFPSDKTDDGVNALMKLKTKTDQWANQKVPGSRLAVNAHVGPAAIGRLKNNSLEMVGEAVATVYSMGKKQFLLSPQAFRKLSPETRKAFRKFTPPIVYRLAS